jgi:hypothetical protein
VKAVMAKHRNAQAHTYTHICRGTHAGMPMVLEVRHPVLTGRPPHAESAYMQGT